MGKKKRKVHGVQHFEDEGFSYPTLEMLTSGSGGPLWNINDGLKKRKRAMKEVLKRLREEHDRCLKDDYVGGIDAGVLLGVRSLVESLLNKTS